MNFGILGSGSWGTAIAKILTDNGNTIYWWNWKPGRYRLHPDTASHNPRYLPAAHFDIHKLRLTTDPGEVIRHSDYIVISIPSAYAVQTPAGTRQEYFCG